MQPELEAEPDRWRQPCVNESQRVLPRYGRNVTAAQPSEYRGDIVTGQGFETRHWPGSLSERIGSCQKALGYGTRIGHDIARNASNLAIVRLTVGSNQDDPWIINRSVHLTGDKNVTRRCQ